MKPAKIDIKPDGTRIVVLHRNSAPVGPPGPAVTGPTAASDSAIALFDGTDGSRLKDSTVILSELATTTNVASALFNKVDKETGKQLTTEDFTTALKNKLETTSLTPFRGTYANQTSLEAYLPSALAGDYANVATPGNNAIRYVWDEINLNWIPQAPFSSIHDGSDIATLLYSQPDTNRFTDAYRLKLDDAVTMGILDAALTVASNAFMARSNNVIVEPTTARTVTITDDQLYIRLTNVSGCTITLPNDAAGTWTNNIEMEFLVGTATLPTISTGAGVTLNNASALATLAQWDTFRLKRVGADVWDLRTNKA